MAKTKRKVLIVDDEPIFQKLLTEKLKSSGFKAASALNGEEALVMVKKEKPDLILLDIVMPKLDGISFLKKLKEDKDNNNIPIIILTNLSDENALATSLEKGVTGYLIKANYTLEELMVKIKERLRI